jgi:nitrogen regulatory protein P-II 2
MKRIDAFIEPSRLNDLRVGLEALGVHSFRIHQCQNVGREPGVRLIYRGLEVISHETRELEVTLLVTDAQVARVVGVLDAVGGEVEIVISAVEEAVESSSGPSSSARQGSAERAVRALHG